MWEGARRALVRRVRSLAGRRAEPAVAAAGPAAPERAPRAELASLIFGGADPFDGFDAEGLGYEDEGWNGRHPALARAIDALRPAIIADVGVWKGQSTLFMAEHLRAGGINGVVLAIDTWLGSPEHWERGSGVGSPLRHNHGYPAIYRSFLANVRIAGLESLVLPFPQTSRNAAVILARAGVWLDVVHLDAAHEYEEVIGDCEANFRILRPGGLLIGDDYVWDSVRKAADRFAARHCLRIEVDSPKWILRKPLP